MSLRRASAIAVAASVAFTTDASVSADNRIDRNTRICLDDSTGVALRFRDTEPYVVRDPQRPADLIAVWQTHGRAGSVIQSSRSHDGGATWLGPHTVPITSCTGGPVTGTSRGSDPWASFANDGRVYLSAIAYLPDSGNGPDLVSALVVVSSPDGGSRWEAPVAAAVAPARSVAYDNLAITADPARPEVVYAATTRSESRDSATVFGQLGFTRSSDGGKTWTAMRTITSPVNRERIGAPQVLVSAKTGRLYVVYHRTTGRSAFIGVMQSDDRGDTWTDEVVAAPFTRLRDPVNPATRQRFVLATDIVSAAISARSGRLAIAYADARSTDGQRAGVSLVWSDDGRRWSVPIPVSDTGPASSWLPSVAANARGDFVVSYFSANFSADSGTTPPMLLLHRTLSIGAAISRKPADTLATWPLAWPGDYHGLVLVGNRAVSVYGRGGDITATAHAQ